MHGSLLVAVQGSLLKNENDWRPSSGGTYIAYISSLLSRKKNEILCLDLLFEHNANSRVCHVPYRLLKPQYAMGL